jgi:hypothetical protein
MGRKKKAITSTNENQPQQNLLDSSEIYEKLKKIIGADRNIGRLNRILEKADDSKFIAIYSGILSEYLKYDVKLRLGMMDFIKDNNIEQNKPRHKTAKDFDLLIDDAKKFPELE